MTVQNRAEGRRKRLIGAAFLWLCALVILLPLAVVVVTSLKSLKEAGSLNLSLPQSCSSATTSRSSLKARSSAA